MSLTVAVALLSGHVAELEVTPLQSVQDIIRMAAKVLKRPLASLAYEGPSNLTRVEHLGNARKSLYRILYIVYILV